MKYHPAIVRSLRPRTFLLTAPLALGFAACAEPPEPRALPCPPAVTAPASPPVVPKVETDVPRALEVRLSPSREGGSEVAVIDVTMRFSVAPVDFGDARPLVLRIAHGAEERVEELAARDSEGSLPLGHGDTDDIGNPQTNAWHTERRARGPFTVSYRVRMPAAGKEAADLSSSSGGLVARGDAFLLLPKTVEPHAIRVRWDLSGLGDGARGASSLGGEDAELLAPPSALATTTWVAGALRRVEIDNPSAKPAETMFFRTTALGDVGFDLLDVAPWAGRVFQKMHPLAEGTPRGPFDLFFRTSGKTGARFDVSLHGRSAIAVVDSGLGFGWPEKRILARALVRTALPWASEGVRWFDEGFLTYYTFETLRRANLASKADLLNEIVARTERYFTSPLASSPSVKLEDSSNPSTGPQAEDRGFLLAASLDAEIRKASGGKRSLEDVLREAVVKPAEGEDPESVSRRISVEALRRALPKEIGQPAFTKLEAVHAGGALLDVPDDAFGPCFEKVKKKLSLQDPGADPKAAAKKKVDGFSWVVSKKAPPTCR